MKRFAIFTVLACLLAAVNASAAGPGDPTYVSGEDRFIRDDVVASCRNTLTGEKYVPTDPVVILWHMNKWGAEGPGARNTAVLEKVGDYWKAAGMAGYIFNIGQFSQKPASSADKYGPENIKWPTLERWRGAAGIVVVDGNLTFGPSK